MTRPQHMLFRSTCSGTGAALVPQELLKPDVKISRLTRETAELVSP